MTTWVTPLDSEVPEGTASEYLGMRFVVFYVPDLRLCWRAYERHTGELVACCVDDGGRKYVMDYIQNRETHDW